ncbi:hypothetical protein P153DRAFT_393489 [Dothidotthia symphoricarpi CBS 119687]|uniref:DUF202 domain-containing protein n=1 Tax=Dothidotthia symphoricarpi CBS 119687 TaxID=1392245 RepID=A0A6A6APS6_9PLEO|nr:uncharacterized protein P153DRAFT_393489 [Dothidotthia symphoricarpi CBS 119687]KAF2132511.1 hypothetical protein P153DRAFT_393489 [Dothidotthia symphoricarpi CBS 119687]
MNDRVRPTLPLELLPAAFYAHTKNEFHPDSEESTRHERRRVSRELESLHLYSASTSNHPTIRSRNAPLRSGTTSREHLQQRVSTTSDVSTQSNVDGSRGEDDASRKEGRKEHWYNPIVKFWTTHVTLTIDEGAHRDHLALERTFLGYLRTSLVLVMTGVTTTQLYRLQHTANTDSDIGFYVIGLPLNMVFIGMAIVVILIGAFRFWKLQLAMSRGKTYSGGWEVMTIMGLIMLILVATFALVLAVNIDKSLDAS